MALAAALVQALDPVVLESRDVKVMRMVLRVLAWLLELLLMRLMRLLEWVCCGQLVVLRMQVVLLRWGAAGGASEAGSDG